MWYLIKEFGGILWWKDVRTVKEKGGGNIMNYDF